MRRLVCVLAALALLALADPLWAQAPAAPVNELDAFMAQVLARRDDNWKKLQQYILDEQERAELRGPGETLLWGEKRDYVWYLRDGYFVRSPVRANGVTVSDADREKYEQDFLKFKFESGKYALAGREKIDGRDVLRIEYYPTKLFSDEPDTRAEARANQAKGHSKSAYGEEAGRLMNKVSLVTLWVEPTQTQIVKYTFDNIRLDFLPGAWLVRITDLKASMLMTEAFPGIWLPRRIDVAAGMPLAIGPLSVNYDLQYSGYREAATSTKYRGVSGR